MAISAFLRKSHLSGWLWTDIRHTARGPELAPVAKTLRAIDRAGVRPFLIDQENASRVKSGSCADFSALPNQAMGRLSYGGLTAAV